MRNIVGLLGTLVVAGTLNCAAAIELYFQPDSSFGNVGDTVEVAAFVTPTDTVRGFTVDMYYDTNLVDLAAAPTVGTLIAGLTGLDFRYQDHTVAAPHRLEVGATVFGSSFWAGPGELFRLKMVFRGCGDVPMTGDFGLRRPDGTFLPADFNPPVFLVCHRVPQSPDSLTIYWLPTGAELRWKASTLDTLGRTLFAAPYYRIWRTELDPVPMPYTLVDSTFSLIYLDTAATANQSEYFIDAKTP